LKLSFVAHLQIDGKINPKALHEILLQRLVSEEDRIKVIRSSIMPEHSSKRVEKIIQFQFPRMRLIRGAWVKLIIEKRNGRTRQVRGCLLNSPILFLQKSSGEVENTPVGSIVDVLEYLSPKEAKQEMIKTRAYRLAKEIRKRERLVARYDAFLLKRVRECEA